MPRKTSKAMQLIIEEELRFKLLAFHFYDIQYHQVYLVIFKHS